MTLRAHTRIDLAYVPAPVLPEGHLGVTVPSVDSSGQVLQVDGGRVVVFSTALAFTTYGSSARGRSGISTVS